MAGLGMRLGVMSGVHNLRVARLAGETSRAKSELSGFKLEMRMLEENLARALMINEALWELMRDKLKLTDQDLCEKLYEVDMRDGELDGKNQAKAVACPQCKRRVSARRAVCMYCATVVNDSVFHMTQ